jgi:hypothetical protein
MRQRSFKPLLHQLTHYVLSACNALDLRVRRRLPLVSITVVLRPLVQVKGDGDL